MDAVALAAAVALIVPVATVLIAAALRTRRMLVEHVVGNHADLAIRLERSVARRSCTLDTVITRRLIVSGEYFCLDAGLDEPLALRSRGGRQTAILFVASSLAGAVSEMVMHAGPVGSGMTVPLRRRLVRIRLRDLPAIEVAPLQWPEGDALAQLARAAGAPACRMPFRSVPDATVVALVGEDALRWVDVVETVAFSVPVRLPVERRRDSDLDAATFQLVVTEALNAVDPAVWLRTPHRLLAGAAPSSVLDASTVATVERLRAARRFANAPSGRWRPPGVRRLR